MVKEVKKEEKYMNKYELNVEKLKEELSEMSLEEIEAKLLKINEIVSGGEV